MSTVIDMAHSGSGWGLDAIRFDVLAAIVGLVIAIMLLPLRFMASQVFIETIPLLLGGACALYLYSVYRGSHHSSFPSLPSSIALFLPSIFMLALAGMVLLVAVQGTRSRLFYGLSAAIGTLLLLQILFTNEEDLHPPILLFQILCFAFVFRFSALYVTPGYIGVDIWTHMTALAEPIYETGSLGAIDHDKHYTSPFHHLLTVAAALLYDSTLRIGLYLSLGLALPISILLIYMTTALLVPVRWAILAAALFAMADYVAHWGMHLIPTSLGFVYFLAILYLLVRIMRIEYARRDFAFLVVLSVAVILTHQVTTLIMLVVFVAALLAQLVFRYGPFGFQQLNPSVFRAYRPVNVVGLVVFNFGLTIFMWSLTPFRQDTFLATVLNWFHETLVDGAGFLNLARPGDAEANGDSAAAAAPTLLDHVVQYVDVLGFLILLGLTFAGCLYVVERDRSQQSGITLLLATAVMLVFVLGMPILGIRNFVPTRWYAFVYAPMVILTVIGLRYFVKRVGPGPMVAMVVVLALIYPAGMVFAAPSNADNPAFPDHNERLAYSETELAAVDAIARMTGGPTASDIRPDQVMYTDHPYHTVIRRSGAYHTEPATVVSEERLDHQYSIYRTAQTTDATYFRDEADIGQLRNIPAGRICLPEQSRLYSNGDVTMCGPSPALAS